MGVFCRAAGVGLITLLTFSKLTVVVDAQGVHFWFGWGWPRKSFALGEVKDVGIVHTSIWEGWGIHWHPSREWTFNVAGSHAVELTMRNRRRYRIGTDEPQRLELAINRALKRT